MSDAATEPRDLATEQFLIELTCPDTIDHTSFLNAIWHRAEHASGEYGDPMQVRVDVDWLTNMREELEDAPFYGVQFLRHRDPNHPASALVMQALTHIARAHDLLRWAQQAQ